MRTRVKFCGITSLEDALSAVEVGADALGFVFVPGSPRAISPEHAADIIRQLPPFVTTVGLVVNECKANIHTILDAVPVSCLQFHGEESNDFCVQFNQPFVKALRVKPGMDVDAEMAQYPDAVGILLDAYHPDKAGGTGESFNWAQVPIGSAKPLVLAGGLTPENVAQAIAATRPFAVDVSSGIEASPGKKDNARMKAFMKQVL